MRHYIAIVHKDADSAFGVHFPDVPGCFSAADEAESLIANASEALALYFEDQPLTAARDIETLRVDPAVSSELAEGAFLLAVPLISLSGRSVRANITMDAGLLSAVDEAAKARGLTRSAFLSDLARREIAG